MDPNECVRLFLFATTLAVRRECAAKYRQWTARGGFRAVVLVNGERHAVLRLHPRWGSDAMDTSLVIEAINTTDRTE
jgi:hypothetical protein